ncbi:hypothetical protein NQ317_011182 [Molorchus minor]|uniref:Uncharacterized protein n=1 Tax=Molorchus minor TaxID=1323400 RepID=A0ABQ9JJE1_9CUCU|nr:hypothetical protein NQ317_011182 [Molorchus minor]
MSLSVWHLAASPSVKATLSGQLLFVKLQYELPNSKYLLIKTFSRFGSITFVTIKESKTKIDKMFVVIDDEEVLTSFMDLYRKYFCLRPIDSEIA